MWIVANIIYCLVKVYTLKKKKKQTFLKHYIKVTARVALEWLFRCEKVMVLSDFSTQSQRITYLNEICDNMEILHSSQSENDEDENANGNRPKK